MPILYPGASTARTTYHHLGPTRGVCVSAESEARKAAGARAAGGETTECAAVVPAACFAAPQPPKASAKTESAATRRMPRC